MARYIGPKTKIARKFADPIFGEDKYFEKRKSYLQLIFEFCHEKYNLSTEKF